MADGGISSQGNSLLWFVPWKNEVSAQAPSGRYLKEQLKSDTVSLSCSVGTSGVEELTE